MLVANGPHSQALLKYPLALCISGELFIISGPLNFPLAICICWKCFTLPAPLHCTLALCIWNSCKPQAHWTIHQALLCFFTKISANIKAVFWRRWWTLIFMQSWHSFASDLWYTIASVVAPCKLTSRVSQIVNIQQYSFCYVLLAFWIKQQWIKFEF